MSLISKIQEKIKLVKQNGDIPTVIWLGKEEKKEFEALVNGTDIREINKEKYSKTEICGLPVKFVSSSSWMSVMSQQTLDV